MPSLFDAPREKPKTPEYYLWSHPQSPYAIELRLDIIDRLMADLRAAQATRLETGGLLIGTFVRAANPTLRIEDYEIVARGPEDGLLYNLTNEQKIRFAAVRHKFISKQIRVLRVFPESDTRWSSRAFSGRSRTAKCGVPAGDSYCPPDSTQRKAHGRLSRSLRNRRNSE